MTRPYPLGFFDNFREMVLNTPWLADGTLLRDVQWRPCQGLPPQTTKIDLMDTVSSLAVAVGTSRVC